MAKVFHCNYIAMAIENIPETYLKDKNKVPELFIYDFRMTSDVVKSKVNLSMNMFSFLKEGKKQVHFADTSIAVNKKQSLLLKHGNCLWTELLETEAIYNCKLLFFSENKLIEFLKKYAIVEKPIYNEIPYFVIENDEYISSYLDSLSTIYKSPDFFIDNLLSIKFEEIMLYLISKYQDDFVNYLHSLVSKKSSPFSDIIEKNVYSNLKLEEIAFLCNMSLSTFKRHFTQQYNITPGKWFQDKKLHKAKEMLESGSIKSSDIYLDFGYNNLSNFSIAFKNKFGYSPKGKL
ncbi:MAG: AraC family transcriptional regulator [Saprospiraceae bacterium]